jgi:YHS domain-containing protein
MVRLLQIIAVIFLIRFFWRAVTRLLSDTPKKSVNDGDGSERMIYRGQMVRDPICGIHVPEESALTESRGDRVYHFCSEKCREAFRRGETVVE